MTTEDLVERIRRYPVQFGCGVILIVCALMFYFRMDVVSEAEGRMEEAQARANRVLDNLSAGASLSDHLEKIGGSAALLEDRIVRPSRLAENLKYFYKVEAQTGVSLGDLKQAGSGTAGAKDDVFVAVPYDIMLSGTFLQAIAFLDELEHGERFFRLKNFNLQRGRDVGQASLTLSTNIELLGMP